MVCDYERVNDGPLLLPSGTVTFLFTDIEGSTRLWESGDALMRLALARHDEILGECVGAAGGVLFKHTGDGACAVFAEPAAALDAARSAQERLGSEVWPTAVPIRVRMGVHTGVAQERDGDYYGPTLNRVGRLMSAGHGGQVLVSAATAELTTEAGLVDLGEHRLRDLGRPEVIRQLGDGAFPAIRTLAERDNNLPQQVTSFVGRSGEVESLVAATDASRLVTLTAVGGAGKTRLALQVAAELSDRFTDGVFLVELAEVTDPTFVVGAIGRAIGAFAAGGGDSQRSVDQLVDVVGERRLLIVLDNCEHLIDAAAAAASALIGGCSQVGVLATSREPLGIAGEAVRRVGSLDLGDAVVLFEQRALAVRPDLDVVSHRESIEAICRRLDALPLAVELAAVRVRALAPDRLLDRLDDAFRILTGGRTSTERHQTLQATLSWSHDLLSEAEQVVLRRLGVFAGGFTLEAAERVAADGEAVEEWEVLDHLTSLVDKSLVQLDSGDRYAMLEIVRQFADSQLATADESTLVRDRHTDWVRDAGDSMLISIRTTGTDPETDSELANIRAALGWTIANNDAARCLGIMTAVGNFWSIVGLIAENSLWLEQALSLDTTHVDPAAIVIATARLGLTRAFGGNLDVAVALTSDAIALSEELPPDETEGRFFAHQSRGLATVFTNHWDREAVEEGHRLAGSDPYLLGLMAYIRGIGSTFQCEPAEQRLLAAQASIAVTAAASMDTWTVSTHGMVALAATDVGDLDTAYAAAAAADAILLDAKSHTTSAMANALVALGDATQERLADAATRLATATTMMHGFGDARVFTDLIYFIGAATLPIDSDVAAQLLGYTSTGFTRGTGAAPFFVQLKQAAIDRHQINPEDPPYRTGIALSAHAAEQLATKAFDQVAQGH